jgi:hypothetical protein
MTAESEVLSSRVLGSVVILGRSYYKGLKAIIGETQVQGWRKENTRHST